MKKPTIQYICARCNQPFTRKHEHDRECGCVERNAVDQFEICPARARAIEEIRRPKGYGSK